MSLLGLLSMGRSFGAVRERPADYHVSEGWLPDFRRRQEREMGDVSGHDTVLSEACWPERDLGSETAPGGEVPRNGLVARPDRTGARRPPTEWRPSGARPSAGGRLMQGELSLSSVRVVRNDLFADDLEVVPRSPRASLSSPSGRAVAGGVRGGWREWLVRWWGLFRRRAC